MGCIEICSQWILQRICEQINFNMGCIEIIVVCTSKSRLNGLTLTWDVLKLCQNKIIKTALCRLTLTWDVLKSASKSFLQLFIQINFNMGCIEMLCNLSPQVVLHID